MPTQLGILLIMRLPPLTRTAQLAPCGMKGQNDRFLTSCFLMLQIRTMTADDLPAIMNIQQYCYQPSLHEEQAVVARRLAQYPDYCWVAEDDNSVCAYLFSYPSVLGKITELGGDFLSSEQTDCLYLHDLAVAQQAAGQGIGPRLAKHALQHARQMGFTHSALVAVQNSSAFWARQGFTLEPELSEEQRHCLASYAVAARYLVQPLA